MPVPTDLRELIIEACGKLSLSKDDVLTYIGETHGSQIKGWYYVGMNNGFRTIVFTTGFLYETTIGPQLMKQIILPLKTLQDIQSEVAYNSILVRLSFANGYRIEWNINASDFKSWTNFLGTLKETV
jgi:hypothetical protein